MNDKFKGFDIEEPEKPLATSAISPDDDVFSLSQKGRVTIQKTIWKKIAVAIFGESDDVLQKTLYYKSRWNEMTNELLLIFSAEKRNDSIYRQVQRHVYGGKKSTAYIDLKYPLSNRKLKLKLDPQRKHVVPFTLLLEEHAIILRLSSVEKIQK